jgi:hypothetical protein
MLGYLKYAGAGLLAAAFLISMWVVSGWRADAMQMSEAKQQAKDAKTELRHQIERTVESDKQRLAMQNKLTAAQELLARKLNTTLNAIKDNAPTSPLCDVPEPAASQLQSLRKGG